MFIYLTKIFCTCGTTVYIKITPEWSQHASISGLICVAYVAIACMFCPICVWASHMSIRIWDIPYAYGPIYAYGAEHAYSLCLHVESKCTI